VFRELFAHDQPLLTESNANFYFFLLGAFSVGPQMIDSVCSCKALEQKAGI